MNYLKINALLRYADLFTPQAPRIAGVVATPRYGATLHVTKGSNDDRRILDKIATIAYEKWQGGTEAKLKMLRAQDRVQYRDGELTGYPNHQVLRATRSLTQGPPQIRDCDGKTILTAADGRPYPGCSVNALVQLYVHDKTDGVQRINCTLLAIQMVAEGPAFPTAAYVPVDADFDNLASNTNADLWT